MKNYLILGDWNVICDSCGRKFKASQVRKDWRGLMVCADDYETRHPSDFLRVQREKIAVPYVRPQGTDTFNSYICSVAGRYGMAEVGTADCARASISNPQYVGYNEEDQTKVY